MININQILSQLKNKKIIIFGAGKIGKSLISLLKELDIKIDYVWDNNALKCDRIEDFTITKPYLQLENKSDFIVLITIYAQEVSKKIYQDLLENNFENIIYEREKLNTLFYDTCKNELNQNKFIFDLNKCHLCPVSKDIEKRCDIYDEYVEKKFMISRNSNKTGIVIPSMGILVSNKCNLTCKGCNQLRDIYKSSDVININVDDILNDLKKISNAVDKIEKVVIVGGESLLHKDINLIIKRIMQIDNIGIIQFITNGTIVPKNNEIFELLSNSRVKVEVSGYGDFLSEKLQANVEIFLKKLKDFNVNYEYVKTLQWFDFGDFEKRNYSKEKWQDVYNTCCFISNDLFNGELHKCARSVFGKHLHRLPEHKNDYINIREVPEEELSKKIDKFLKNTLPSTCQHCHGTSSLTMPAGQQI